VYIPPPWGGRNQRVLGSGKKFKEEGKRKEGKGKENKRREEKEGKKRTKGKERGKRVMMRVYSSMTFDSPPPPSLQL
jgi:hypothetical protein